MTEARARSKFDKEVTDEEVRAALADEIAAVLEPVAQPIDLDPSLRPQIVLVVGVNGTGKTTTIGKLAKHLTADGQKVMLAAGDTFRAAAVEQLRIWGERAGCPVISRDTGADAAGLAYDAVEAARREGSDLLLIDTAGRLHNKDDLMAGLAKIVPVRTKLDPEAPHDRPTVPDATTGQNALAQVDTFRDTVSHPGPNVTKLPAR